MIESPLSRTNATSSSFPLPIKGEFATRRQKCQWVRAAADRVNQIREGMSSQEQAQSALKELNTLRTTATKVKGLLVRTHFSNSQKKKAALLNANRLLCQIHSTIASPQRPNKEGQQESMTGVALVQEVKGKETILSPLFQREAMRVRHGDLQAALQRLILVEKLGWEEQAAASLVDKIATPILADYQIMGDAAHWLSKITLSDYQGRHNVYLRCRRDELLEGCAKQEGVLSDSQETMLDMHLKEARNARREIERLMKTTFSQSTCRPKACWCHNKSGTILLDTAWGKTEARPLLMRFAEQLMPIQDSDARKIEGNKITASTEWRKFICLISEPQQRLSHLRPLLPRLSI